ncbi:MAG: Cof-type HAD-IIB family hydrolase [Firmicutes bacterium]|nr:Cof-type HAD-IIB family hydrolase [Bacillota bacterium]
MKYKLVISDFDGTLQRDDGTVSQRTVKAIKDYIARGGIFTVSTGRMCKSILPRLAELGLDKVNIPLMGYQGARIIDNITGEVFFESNISNEESISIVRDCKKLDIYHQIYCAPERLITNEYTWISDAYYKAAGVKAEAAGDLEEFLTKTKLDCHKILTIVKPEQSRDIMKYFAERYSKSTAYISHPSFVEMVNREGSKGIAAKWAAKKFGIKISEVLGVGDSLNDLPLIEATGCGVAVANAMPELKAAADIVSKYSNNEDAVARLLEEL